MRDLTQQALRYADVFDPADIEGLFYWDDVGSAHGWWPPSLREREIVGRNSADLAQYILDLRNALLLPLSAAFSGGIREILGVAEQEAQKRRRMARKGISAWRGTLLGLVRQATGEQGRPLSGQWFFRCPFHDEKTGSLHVDPATDRWHCFGCAAGGGVVQFRKAREGDRTGGQG